MPAGPSARMTLATPYFSSKDAVVSPAAPGTVTAAAPDDFVCFRCCRPQTRAVFFLPVSASERVRRLFPLPCAVFLPISAVLLHICSFRRPLSLLLFLLQIHSRWHRIPLLLLHLFLRISEFLYIFFGTLSHRGSDLFIQEQQRDFCFLFFPHLLPFCSPALLFSSSG